MTVRERRAHGSAPQGTEPANATVEFVGIIAVLIVPALILLAVLSMIASAQFAVQSGARNAARDFVRAASLIEARAIAQERSQAAWSARGLDGSPSVRIDCSQPVCLSPGADVTVTVSGSVELPVLGTRVSVSDAVTVTAGDYRVIRP